MFRQLSQLRRIYLCTCLVLGMLAANPLTRPLQGQEKFGTPSSAVKPVAVPHAAAVPISNAVTSGHQATSLRRIWGIDDVHVRYTASGSLICFTYRVVDAEKAKVLNDKRATPYLVDEKDGLALQVPTVDQVGQLRQVAMPQNGREYWMAFSNKGRILSPGNHVTVMIGRFRAEELVVEATAGRPRR
jgi:hypothetical protein